MDKIKDYDYLDALNQVTFKLNEIEKVGLLKEDMKSSTYSKIEEARRKIIDASYELELENMGSGVNEKRRNQHD